MAEEEGTPINLSIVDGDSFFAHEISINFTATQFLFDFKCITPRIDPRSAKPSFQLKHNVVMVEPWHAKAIHEVLTNVIKKYEEEFGKIEKPKAIEIAEKKQKALLKKNSSFKRLPTYFG